MTSKIFITGTGTSIGKTYVSTGLLHACLAHGFTTLGIKPLATGCHYQNGFLYSEDALALQQASTIKLEYHHINPFAFKPPIAPNIAASEVNHPLSISAMIKQTQYALTYPADLLLIEGIGGWMIPINDDEIMADFAIQCQLPIILVIGIQLGCINHALLTYHAINHSPAKLIGWIANCFDPHTLVTNEIIMTLKNWIKTPLLSIVPYQNALSRNVDIKQLLYLASN